MYGTSSKKRCFLKKNGNASITIMHMVLVRKELREYSK